MEKAIKDRSKIMVVGGFVTARDGDRHYISSTRLCILYGLNKNNVLLVDETRPQSMVYLTSAHHDDYIKLFPREDGNYSLDRDIAELLK
tara:strand:+ start:255 stop:521 length:267 start_codon:yes stop_codon:yes gene_type:complete